MITKMVPLQVSATITGCFPDALNVILE